MQADYRQGERTFIVAAKKSQRRVVPQPLYDVLGLFAHTVHKFRVGRVYTASELEVLPHEDAEFWRKISYGSLTDLAERYVIPSHMS